MRISTASNGGGKKTGMVRFWFILVVLVLLLLLSQPTVVDNYDGLSGTPSSKPASLEEHKASLIYMGNQRKNTGWYVDKLCLQHKPLVVYGVGVGEDISWDVAMVKEFGASQFIFDPTERAQRYVESVLASKGYKNIEFLPFGLGHFTGDIVYADRVSKPAVENADKKLTQTVTAHVRTLQDFMREFRHDYLDVLKMDIEGVEYGVLESLLENDFMPFTQLLVEYHDWVLQKDERDRHTKLLASLKEAGFVELWSGNNGQERGYIKERDLAYCADSKSPRSASVNKKFWD